MPVVLTQTLKCFHVTSPGLIECYLASNSIREAMVMANNVYKTLGANAQTLTLLATVCLEDPVTQEKAKTLLDKALTQRPDYIKAVVKKAELLSKFFFPPCWFVHGRVFWSHMDGKDVAVIMQSRGLSILS